MYLPFRKVLPFFIILLFIIGISWSIYLYIIDFDFENYFSYSPISIEWKIVIILLLYIFRNYLFIPSTLAILFTGFFLQDFWLTLYVSTIGVGIGILQVYLVGYIFWDSLKKYKHFQVISKYNSKIEKNGFKVIFFWTLIPMIPVDLIYYSAWFIKYKVWKVFLAGLLWEIPLIIIYSYLWKEAQKYDHYFPYIAIGVIIAFLFYFLIHKKKPS